MKEPEIGEQAPAQLPKHLKALIELARQNRQASTKAESFLWQILRGRKLHNRKFRRQHPFGRFIADFYCDDARLLVELDGSYHNEEAQMDRDQERDAISRQLGLTVLRFTNEEVLTQTDSVIEALSNHLLMHAYER